MRDRGIEGMKAGGREECRNEGWRDEGRDRCKEERRNDEVIESKDNVRREGG